MKKIFAILLLYSICLPLLTSCNYPLLEKSTPTATLTPIPTATFTPSPSPLPTLTPTNTLTPTDIPTPTITPTSKPVEEWKFQIGEGGPMFSLNYKTALWKRGEGYSLVTTENQKIPCSIEYDDRSGFTFMGQTKLGIYTYEYSYGNNLDTNKHYVTYFLRKEKLKFLTQSPLAWWERCKPMIREVLETLKKLK